jgi:hypothetical protein
MLPETRGAGQCPKDKVSQKGKEGDYQSRHEGRQESYG